tara:strand:- start:1099 stop:2037 length:939 start_codon:yes stop_codon:yes gene_type:complete
MKNKVLITSTSFQDSPGDHHDLIKRIDWDIDFLRGPLSEGELIKVIQDYDGIICGDDNYSSNVLSLGKRGRLKVLSKYGVGLDSIDINTAKSLGIKVLNCPSLNYVSVSEHVLALLFAFTKNIHSQYNSVQNYSWNRAVGNEISGMNIGIIGLGSVGKELSRKSYLLGMNVYAHDMVFDNNFLKENPQIKFLKSIDEIYRTCDVISLNIPHNEKTNKLINRNVLFKKMKKNVILINTSRAAIVDHKALIDALNDGTLKGYLTDVLLDEPISKNEKLVGLKNVIITPHIASRTHENIQKQGIQAIKNLYNNLI